MDGLRLRNPRLVIVGGYAILCIAAAIDALAAGFRGVSPDGVVTLHVSTSVSFAILGGAWWAFLGVLQSSPVPSARLRTPMLLFAIGTGVLVVGELALLHYYLTPPGWGTSHLDTRFWVIVESVSLSAAGYLVVVGGFWWASRADEHASSRPDAGSDTFVSSSPDLT